MEITTVLYRDFDTVTGGPIIRRHDGAYHIVEGGIVIIVTDTGDSQMFLPYSSVIRINQTLSPYMDIKEKTNKGLLRRHAKR